MSGFVDNLSYFLKACRNDILQEIYENNEYAELKTKSMELYEILCVSIPSECNTLLTDFVDVLTAISSIEDSYCYLCGMRDGNKPDIQFSAADIDLPLELATHKVYSETKSKNSMMSDELQAKMDAECRKLFIGYVETKKTILKIENTYCYSGGLRDKKRLDNQFDPSAAKEWNALIHTFL